MSSISSQDLLWQLAQMLFSYGPFMLAWLGAIIGGALIVRRHPVPALLLMLAGVIALARLVFTMLASLAVTVAYDQGVGYELIGGLSMARGLLSMASGLLCQIMLLAAIFGWRGETEPTHDLDDALPH